MSDTETLFLGHRWPDEHRPAGRRAWHSWGWCYPDIPCPRCAETLADENPCPCCDGTGIATDEGSA